MTKYDLDNNRKIGYKLKVPIGQLPKNSKAVITCILYTECAMEDGAYKLSIPFKYIPESLFKNDQNSSFIEDIETRDSSGK